MYDTGVYGMGFDPYSETGWFGSKLVKKVGKAVGGAAKGIGKGVVSGAKFVGGKVLPTALPYIQQAMKAMGPVGMVASGAAGALAAVARGSSLENVAWAAAEGASPPGIDRALQVAKALAKGDSVLNVAVNQARNSLSPGPAQMAFDTAINTVKSGSKGALASARNNLRTAAEKAAFDAGVGTVSKAASRVTKIPSMAPRLPIPRYRAPGYSPHRQLTNVALNTLRRNPSLLRLPIREIAYRTGFSPSRVREARGLIEVGMVYGDTGAASSVLPYKIKSGDIPYQLAKKFTGDQNRWREIPGVNKVGMANYKGGKDMKVVQKVTTDPKTKKKTTTTLLDPFYSGLEINLPGDWNVPGAQPIVVGGPMPGTTPSTPYPVPTAPPPMAPPATIPTGTSPIPMPVPPIANGNIPMPGPIPGLPIPASDKPSSPIPMPGPVPIPGTTSPVPMPGPTMPTEIPKPPLTAEQKKKKDATAAAAGLALAGLLFFA